VAQVGQITLQLVARFGDGERERETNYFVGVCRGRALLKVGRSVRRYGHSCYVRQIERGALFAVYCPRGRTSDNRLFREF
jgi:hypothetical protein